MAAASPGADPSHPARSAGGPLVPTLLGALLAAGAMIGALAGLLLLLPSARFPRVLL